MQVLFMYQVTGLSLLWRMDACWMLEVTYFIRRFHARYLLPASRNLKYAFHNTMKKSGRCSKTCASGMEQKLL
ncbi:hypothetical protein LIER_26112 [Lithospermum erythrorhizon]|uniref:Secreted protein n=1 Tax=Lithospermum erythrorhizon TaxID=34254 RepID=A0AAV3RD38_LITER